MALVQDPMMSDDELVARVRDGDDVAFERLYGRYGGRIGGFVAGMVGDAGRAEDVTQEVFVSALRRMRTTERSIHFKPWVYEIARNAAIDEHRRTRRMREVSVAHESDGQRPGLEALPSGEPAPQQALETQEALGNLTSALGGLSDMHRRVIVLRELEGRSYEEIAATTGLSRSAVESALFRARKRLGDEYAELSSGRRCEAVRELIVAPGHLRSRERSGVRRHLSHCQSCRRHAAAHGVDPASVGLLAGPRRRVARIAGILPVPTLPAWLTQLTAGSGDAPIAWGKAVATTAVVLAAGGTGIVASYDRATTRPAMGPVGTVRAADDTAADRVPAASPAAGISATSAVREPLPYRASKPARPRAAAGGRAAPKRPATSASRPRLDRAGVPAAPGPGRTPAPARETPPPAPATDPPAAAPASGAAAPAQPAPATQAPAPAPTPASVLEAIPGGAPVAQLREAVPQTVARAATDLGQVVPTTVDTVTGTVQALGTPAG